MPTLDRETRKKGRKKERKKHQLAGSFRRLVVVSSTPMLPTRTSHGTYHPYSDIGWPKDKETRNIICSQ